MTPMAALETKRCTSCHKDKPLDEFYQRSDRVGLHSHCKACAIARSVAWQQENPERARAAVRKHRQAHPENRKRDRLQVAAYQVAEARLREAHRDEFDRYYAEERAKRGLS